MTIKALRSALAVLVVGLWCLVLQVGPDAGRAFALAPSPVNPVSSPQDSGVVSSTSTADVTISSAEVLEDGTEAAGVVCAAGAVETVGASCIAAAVAEGAVAATATALLVFHLVSHSGVSPAPPSWNDGTDVVCPEYGWTSGTVPCWYGGVDWPNNSVGAVYPGSGVPLNVTYVMSDGTREYETCSWSYGLDAGTLVQLTLGGGGGGGCGAPSGAVAVVFHDVVGSAGGILIGGTLPEAAPWSGTASGSGTCSDGSTASVSFDSGSADLSASCPAGTWLDGLNINADGATSTWNPPTDWCQSVTSTSSCTGQDAPGTAQYPECAPGATSFPCQVVWEVKNPDYSTEEGQVGVGSPEWIPCTASPADCYGWPSTDPDSSTTEKSLTVTVTGSESGSKTFRCAFGPYVLTIADCYAADAQAGTGALTTATSETTTPAEADSGEDSCFPQGFSDLINPIDWVETPVKCALRWALVPNAAAEAKLENDWTTLEGVPPVSFAVAGYTWLGTVTSGATSGTCDVGISIPTWDSVSFEPLDFCPDSPLYNALHAYRGLMLVAIWVVVIAPLVFYLVRTSIPGGGD